MFRCSKCKNLSQPNEKQNKVVLESRAKNYFTTEKGFDSEGNEILTQGKLIGSGFETAREIVVCNNCKGN